VQTTSVQNFNAQALPGAGIEPALYRAVMRRHASSVVVLSVVAGDRPHFMTATSFTQVSLSPPLVLFCIHRDNDTHALLDIGSRVGVSLLAEEQAPVSQRFASKGPDRHRTDDLALHREAGALLIGDACAALVLDVQAAHPAGDHSIFIGHVLWAHADGASRPLLYHDGRYGAVAAAS